MHGNLLSQLLQTGLIAGRLERDESTDLSKTTGQGIMNVGNDATLVDGERFSVACSYSHRLSRYCVSIARPPNARARERCIDCLFNAPDAIQHDTGNRRYET